MIERKAKRHAKAAVFAAAHAKYWEQFDGLYEKIMGYHSKLLTLVRENDIEVIDFGMIDSSEKSYAAADKINAANPDLIICNMVTYATSSVFAPIMRSANAPVILTALQPLSKLDYSKASTFMQLENDNICSVPEFTGVAVRLGKKVNDVIDNINLEVDLEKALKDADLVIESMSEDFDAKKNVYESIKNKLKDETIIVTNSSTMLPSKLAKYTGRSDKFLALHFANSICKNNIVEVMRHNKTSDSAFNEVMDFAKNIRMIPLPLNKEKSGYLLNSMLIPLLFSALDLLVNEISDVKSIDTAWKRGTGSPKGPFEILDTVGLKTAYDIVLMYVKIPKFLAPYNFRGMEKLLKKYIDEGKLGKSSKEGFYKYIYKTPEEF